MVGHAEYHASWLVMQNIKHHGMPPISSLSDRPQNTYSRLVRIHTYINGDIISLYLSVPYIHTQTLSPSHSRLTLNLTLCLGLV